MDVNDIMTAARELCAGNRLAQAETMLRKLPPSGESCRLLGFICHQTGRIWEAVTLLAQALELDSDNPMAWNLYCVALQSSGLNDQALEAGRRAVALAPESADAWNNLGAVRQARGASERALDCYQSAVKQRADHPDAWSNMGAVLHELGRFDESVTALERALDINPKNHRAHYHLGNTRRTIGRLEEAVADYRAALALMPQYPQAWNNLGNTLQAQGHDAEAETAYRKALEFTPNASETWNNLASALQYQSRITEAIDHYRHALELKTPYPEAHSNLLLCLNYLADGDPEQILQEHRAWQVSNAPEASPPVYRNTPDHGRPLRIGYVSPDLRTHSVAYFIEPILRNHSPQCEIYCFANVLNPDETSQQMMTLPHEWVDIRGLDPHQVSRRIRKRYIDILVDLAGHTAHNSLQTFALKPAPVQVSYLGYPNTSGLDTIDYRLTDNRADPPGEDAYYAESLFRMPGCFLTFQPPSVNEAIGSPPNAPVTFASFNNLCKVNEVMIRLWAEILTRVPGARLLLKARPFIEASTRQRFLDAFAQARIDPGRIELVGHIPSRDAHLELYHRIHIALDTYPYNGTTTTCEALHMGVPLVSLRGKRHISRVGYSLLSTVGLGELVADTPQAYVEIAASLAGDPERLAAYRAGIRPKLLASPLCQPTEFVRKLEAAYRTMWQQYCTPHATFSNGV